jgi:Pyruvate/2-oxoacid:ferredoxin oxidoreductase gamma subunit
MKMWKRTMEDVGDTAELIRTVVPVDAGERLVAAAEAHARAMEEIRACVVVYGAFIAAALVIRAIFGDD